MSACPSSYYPRRARWYSGVFHAWYRWRRRLGSKPSPAEEITSLRQCLLACILPGYAFLATGHRWVGLGCQLAYGVLGLAFFVALGHPAANVAMGLMIGLHAAGILRGLCPPEGMTGYVTKFLQAVGVLVALCLLVYFPARNWVTEHLFIPLRVGQNVVVINRLTDPQTLQRGDRVAYRIDGANPEHGYYVRAGYGIDPLLGQGGDRVGFTRTALVINGVPQPRQRYMPTNGVVVVPEHTLFIWPTLAEAGHGMAAPDRVVRNLALVDESRFVGKAFESWFWHKQVLP